MFAVQNEPSIDDLLRHNRNTKGDQIYLRFAGRQLTYGELDDGVSRVAKRLTELGVKRTSRVGVLLPNGIDAIFAFFALIRLRAVQVPVNINLKGESLTYLLTHSEPQFLIADERFREVINNIELPSSVSEVVWCTEQTPLDGESPYTADIDHIQTDDRAHEVVSIMYTSGTTGPPKGVQVTDKMLRACAYSSGVVADVQAGDCFYLWEPIYHVTGAEVLILGLMHDISIGMCERFSASRFWGEVALYEATHIHYVGGILQILMRQPKTELERNNSVRIAWGGGAPSALWDSFASRFGLVIRENYGMTETSSLTSFNTDGKAGSVGKPAPYFDVGIFNDSGEPVAVNTTGEICVRDKGAGLITAGYFRNRQATENAFRDSWFRTGDVGRLDTEGYLYYEGRLKDSVRRRGENISAWEIERVVEQLPWVEECALIGVPDELGDEELKLFVKTAIGHEDAPADLFAWCDAKLAGFQVPRFLCFVSQFDKTDTQRIQKERLSRSIGDSWTRTRGGQLMKPES